MNSKTVGDRLRMAMKAAKVTGDMLSEQIDLSLSGIRKWTSGQTDPGFSHMARAADALGLSLDWLATGEGSMWRSGANRPAAEPPAAPSNSAIDGTGREFGLSIDAVPRVTPAVSPAGVAAFALSDDAERIYVRLPLYVNRASAGAGLAVRDEALSADVLFSADWLWRTLRRPPESLICLQAHGDSMEPRIRHNDVLIVDTSVERIRDNGIYCFSYEGDLMVKRLYRDLKSRALRIVSDNSNYPTQELSADEANRLNVVGLVVWQGGITR